MQHLLLVLALYPQLVLAHVHELLGGLQPSGSAALEVGLLLAASLERLEGGVVNELCLLDHLEQVLGSIVRSLPAVAPIQEVVIVDHATGKVGLTQHRDVVHVVVVVEGAHEAIGETGLADADLATVLLRARHAHHRHIDLFLRQDLLLQVLPYLLHRDGGTCWWPGVRGEGL